MSDNYFVQLSQIDVSEHIEKKGKFSYLSWAYAVDQLRSIDPEATWEVVRFDGLPFLQTDCGYFVEVAVTVKGITLSQIHPVLDNSNKPIAKPNAFQINTSLQRCLVKAIALHGLGLYIYAGEDLPMDNTPPTPITSEQVGILKTLVLEFVQIRGVAEARVFQELKVSDITKLTSQDAQRCIDQVMAWIDKAKKEA
ncbi:MAG: DUF1071 domain-containing protein [Bacillus sp. (in: firmicutes)]